MLRLGFRLGVCLGALCLAVGCSRQSNVERYKITTPDEIKLLTPTERIVKGGKFGNIVVERHVTYVDGTQGSVFFRSEDGSLKYAKETYSDGTEKSSANFDEKEKLISGEVRRPDGKRYVHMQGMPDGKLQMTYYSPDDKKIAFRERAADGKSWEDTYYRSDSSAIGKVTYFIDENNRQTESNYELFPVKAGDYRLKVQFMAGAEGANGGREVSYFDNNKRKVFSQLFRDNGWNWQRQGPSLLLERVEEFDWQGNVSRTLYFKEEITQNWVNGTMESTDVVKLVASKTTETFWTTSSLRAVASLFGTNPLGAAAALQAQFGAPMPRRRPPTWNGGTNAQTREVTRTYRLDEKDIEEVVIEKWEYEQRWNRAQPVLEFKRTFHNGTLLQLTRGEKKEDHEASEKLHETVNVTQLKLPETKTLEQTRDAFQRQDTRFLGDPDPKDPCRWYHR